MGRNQGAGRGAKGRGRASAGAVQHDTPVKASSAPIKDGFRVDLHPGGDVSRDMVRLIDKDGKRVGGFDLSGPGRLDIDDPTARVIGLSRIEDSLQGKGLGKAMYESAGEQLAKQGMTLYSDGKRSPQAEGVWQSLAKSGKAVKVDMPMTQRGYVWKYVAKG